MLLHMGPIVMWKAGERRAEIAVRTLELSSDKRTQLISRKIEKINEVQNLVERYNSESDVILKALLKRSLLDAQEKSSEFSGMVCKMISGAI